MTSEEAYNYLKDSMIQDEELDYDSLFFLSITDLYTEIYRTIIYSPIFLEKIILKDLKYIYLYAKYVLKGRWPEAENIILESKDPYWIFWYTRDVLKDRWPEGEKALLENKDPEYIYEYAKEILKDRWIEAESIILNSEYCEKYKEKFGIRDD